MAAEAKTSKNLSLIFPSRQPLRAREERGEGKITVKYISCNVFSLVRNISLSHISFLQFPSVRKKERKVKREKRN